jgi:hypothetical protein
MQKRESFYAELCLMPNGNSWIPAPREYSTLCFTNRKCWLVGGLNHECNKEVAQLSYSGDLNAHVLSHNWKNMEYYSNDKIIGRCRHTACTYNDKVYIFAGCFMFNMKRQIRECTSQVVCYDTFENTMNIIKTKGISI